MEFTLKLTGEEVDVIGSALSELKLKDGIKTYLNILNQVEQQKMQANQQVQEVAPEEKPKKK